MFDLTPPPSDPLLDRASAIAAFEILDHTCGGLEPLLRREQPSRPTLAPARYYLAGVNSGQRRVYDGHCSERYAERSPFHYTSREEVAARAVLAGDIWAGRAVYEVSDAFVAFDGLVLQDSESPARLFAFERMPGFNGLGRLLLALERLQLLRLAPGQRQASLRPADLTLGRFAARHREQVEELPEERGIENVHAFTYARTFAAAGGAGGEEASAQCRASEPVLAAGAVRRSRCLLVIEQFWTANYWHWLTDALPKALLFATMREAGLFDPECKVLAYDLGWNRQFLALAGYDDSQVLAYDATRLDHACRVLLPTMALHQRADVVVGVHGAGLANVLWARRGCHVVEIVPVDVHLDFQCGLTPFWYVSELLGLRKHAFIAYAGRMFEPFELPIVEFVAFLRAAGVVAQGGGLQVSEPL